jgi:hypothetical protein
MRSPAESLTSGDVPMRNGFLSSLAALLAGSGLALAQSGGPYAPRPMVPPPGYGPPPAVSQPPNQPGGGYVVVPQLQSWLQTGSPVPAAPVKPTSAVADSLPPAAPPASSTRPAAPALIAPESRPLPESYGPTLDDIDPGAPLHPHPELAGVEVDHNEPPPPWTMESCHPKYYWASADYLLGWRFKGAPSVPLVTTGPTGAIGANGTNVLLDNLGFTDDNRDGARFTVGFRFPDRPKLMLEGNYFFLSDRSSSIDFSSPGTPQLFRPFFNATTGLEDAFPVATSPSGAGQIRVNYDSNLWGTELNMLGNLFTTRYVSLSVIGGFRYLQLEENLGISDQFTSSSAVPVFGSGSVLDSDSFKTRNQFYGGQVGADFNLRWNRFFVDTRGKVAFGTNHEVVIIQGATELGSGSGLATSFPTGRFALPTNSGKRSHDEASIVYELGLNVGMNLTHHIRVYAGYTYLPWNDVVRPGQQIDRVINTSQIPTAVGPGTLVGTPRPAVPFQQSDFWAQGINVGLELSY